MEDEEEEGETESASTDGRDARLPGAPTVGTGTATAPRETPVQF